LCAAFPGRSGQSWQSALAGGTACALRSALTGAGHDLIHLLNSDCILVLQCLQFVAVDLNPVLKINDRRGQRADRTPLNDIVWN
jgi:hypothetical protein